jgi:hypothetical protein
VLQCRLKVPGDALVRAAMAGFHRR